MDKKKLLLSIITLSIPAILEMALNTLLGFSDTVMISRLIGSQALAGVGFANQIIFTIIFIFTSFNTGGTAMISRTYGEKNYKQMNLIAGEIITLNMILGIILSLLSFSFGHSLFRIFDMTPAVTQMALDYFNIVVIGMIFMFLSFSFAAILRGSGDTKSPMLITGVVNIFNIIGNYVLITGVGPFPALGIKGTALATTISRGIAVLLYIRILLNNNRKLQLKIKNIKITKEILKPLWKLSYPGAIEQTLMNLAFIATGVIVSFLDTSAEATFRILINIESISFMPAVGLSIASATLVGKALGEKNIEKSILTGYLSSGIGFFWGILTGILFITLPSHLLSIFTEEVALIQAGTLAITLAGINQPLLNYIIVQGGALRGAGDTRGVMIITSLRLWLVFVPLNYIFIKVMNMGIEAVYIAEIISFTIFAFVIFFRFKKGDWTKIDIYDTTENESISSVQ